MPHNTSTIELKMTEGGALTLGTLLSQVDIQLEKLLLEHLLRFEGRSHASQEQCDGTLAFLNVMQTTQQAIAQILEASPLRSQQQERCSGMIKALALYLQTTMNRVETYCQARGHADGQMVWYLRRAVQDDLLALLDKTDRAYDVLETLLGDRGLGGKR